MQATEDEREFGVAVEPETIPDPPIIFCENPIIGSPPPHKQHIRVEESVGKAPPPSVNRAVPGVDPHDATPYMQMFNQFRTPFVESEGNQDLSLIHI